MAIPATTPVGARSSPKCTTRIRSAKREQHQAGVALVHPTARDEQARTLFVSFDSNQRPLEAGTDGRSEAGKDIGVTLHADARSPPWTIAGFETITRGLVSRCSHRHDVDGSRRARARRLRRRRAGLQPRRCRWRRRSGSRPTTGRASDRPSARRSPRHARMPTRNVSTSSTRTTYPTALWADECAGPGVRRCRRR